MPKRLPYWDLAKMQELHRIIANMSKPLNNSRIRVITGGGSLKWPVYLEFLKSHPEVNPNLVGYALDMLVKMDVIDPVRPGVKGSNFKRFFDPTAPLTQKGLDEAYAKISKRERR